MTEKIIHWWNDSSGRHTCHENIKGVTADQSYLGEIREIDGVWKMRSVENPEWRGDFKNRFTAMKALEAHVCGRQLNYYD